MTSYRNKHVGFVEISMMIYAWLYYDHILRSHDHSHIGMTVAKTLQKVNILLHAILYIPKQNVNSL